MLESWAHDSELLSKRKFMIKKHNSAKTADIWFGSCFLIKYSLLKDNSELWAHHNF